MAAVYCIGAVGWAWGQAVEEPNRSGDLACNWGDSGGERCEQEDLFVERGRDRRRAGRG